MEPGSSGAMGAAGFSLTPSTEGTKPGNVKKRQRPPSGSGSARKDVQSLCNFSLKVCNVAQSKRETSYNEVADTLVDEITGPAADRTPEQDNEARNVRRSVCAFGSCVATPLHVMLRVYSRASTPLTRRAHECHRRVYDALNVLEALDIIRKEKKSVFWRGFPETQCSRHFTLQKREQQARAIAEKEQKLRALLGQHVAFQQLVRRNRARATESTIAASPSAASSSPPAAPQSASPRAAPISAPPSAAPLSASASQDAQVAIAGGRPAQTVAASSASHACGSSVVRDNATGDDAGALSGSACGVSASTGARRSLSLAGDGEAAAEGAMRGTSRSAEEVIAATVSAADKAAAIARRLRAQRLQMPVQFVATQTPSNIDCALTPDHLLAVISFEHPFSVHDDTEVLRGLGLHTVQPGVHLSELGVPEFVMPYAKGAPLAEVSKGYLRELGEEIDEPEPDCALSTTAEPMTTEPGTLGDGARGAELRPQPEGRSARATLEEKLMRAGAEDTPVGAEHAPIHAELPPTAIGSVGGTGGASGGSDEGAGLPAGQLANQAS